MPCKFTRLEIPEVILIEPRVFPDPRGYFLESYKEKEFSDNGIDVKFVQDNHSVSQKDVLRGLHFQRKPKCQAKLVRVAKGAIFDVAVDIRKNSPTYLKWIGVELSEENHLMLYIPEGFAHGFVSLRDETHLLYKCSDDYSPQHDGGIKWDDKDICIKWPIENPLVSEKDEKLPYVKECSASLDF